MVHELLPDHEYDHEYDRDRDCDRDSDRDSDRDHDRDSDRDRDRDHDHDSDHDPVCKIAAFISESSSDVFFDDREYLARTAAAMQTHIPTCQAYVTADRRTICSPGAARLGLSNRIDNADI